jgi:plastocyanin domain-containing protein
MMVLAISSGNIINGAGILLAFTLGTVPVFFLMGIASSELLKRKVFNYIASAIIVILGLLSINSALSLLAPKLSFQYLYRQAVGYSSDETATIINGKQYVKIIVRANGYKTEVNTLKAGIPTELTLVTNNVYSCARSFTIPSYNISKVLPPTGEVKIEFTPQTPGQLFFSCSMGMYTGHFLIK